MANKSKVQILINAKDNSKQAFASLGKSADMTASKFSVASAVIAGVGKTAATIAVQIAKTVTNLAKQILRIISNLIKAGVKALKSAFVSLSASIAKAVNEAKNLETVHAQMKVLIGDVEKANQAFKQLRTLAKDTPLEFANISSGANQLLAFGTKAEELATQIKMIGDLSMADDAKFETLVYSFGKIEAKNKVLLRDLYNFANNGIPIFESLAEVLGVSTQDVFDLSRGGKIFFDDVNRALQNLTSEGGKFYGMLDTMLDTTQGKWDKFKEQIRLLWADVGERMLPAVKRVLDELMTQLDDFVNGETFNKLVSWIDDMSLKIIEAVPLITSLIGTFAKDFSDWFNDYFSKKDFADFIGDLIGIVLNAIQLLGPTIYDSFKQILGNIWNLAVPTFKALATIMVEFLSMAISDFMFANPKIAGFLGMGVDNKRVNSLLDKNEEAYNNVMNYVPGSTYFDPSEYSKYELITAMGVLAEDIQDILAGGAEAGGVGYMADAERLQFQYDLLDMALTAGQYSGVVTTNFRDIASSIGDGLNLDFSWLSGAVTEIGEGMGQVISDFLNPGGSYFGDTQSLIDSIVGVFKGEIPSSTPAASTDSNLPFDSYGVVGRTPMGWLEKAIMIFSSGMSSGFLTKNVLSSEWGMRRYDEDGNRLESGADTPSQLSMFSTSLGNALGSLESLQKILNPMTTIVEGMMEILEPILNQILTPIVGVLKIVGQTLGKILAPIFEMLASVVEKVADGFVWLYNKAIRPIANGLIEVFNALSNSLIAIVNGVISAINWALGWAGVNIGKINYRDHDAGKISEISFDSLQQASGLSGSSGVASSSSATAYNISVYQTINGNVIGDGGMEQMGKFFCDAVQKYLNTGAKVKFLTA